MNSDSTFLVVNIVNEGRQEQVPVKFSDSVKGFKKFLAERFQSLNGRESDIALNFGGKPLLDPDLSLQDYAITNESLVEVSIMTTAPYVCPKCSLPFSSSNRVPCSLQCGHAICHSCCEEVMAAERGNAFSVLEISCAKCNTTTIWSKEKLIKVDEKKKELMDMLRSEIDLAIQERNRSRPKCVRCECCDNDACEIDSVYCCLDCASPNNYFCSACHNKDPLKKHTSQHSVDTVNETVTERPMPKCVPCSSNDICCVASSYCMKCHFVCVRCHSSCNDLKHEVAALSAGMFLKPVMETLKDIEILRLDLLSLNNGLRSEVQGLFEQKGAQEVRARLDKAAKFFEESRQEMITTILDRCKEYVNHLLESLDETGAQLSALDTVQCALEYYSKDPNDFVAVKKGFDYVFNVEEHRNLNKDLVTKHSGKRFELPLVLTPPVNMMGDDVVAVTAKGIHPFSKRSHWMELILCCATLLLLIIGRLSSHFQLHHRRVLGYTDSQKSANNSAVFVDQKADPPDLATLLPVPRTIRLLRSSPESITLSWDSPPENSHTETFVEWYQLQVSEEDGGSSRIVTNSSQSLSFCASDGLSVTDNCLSAKHASPANPTDHGWMENTTTLSISEEFGLQTGKSYRFQVRTVSFCTVPQFHVCHSSWSDPVLYGFTEPRIPPPVTSLYQIERFVGGKTITIRWLASADNGGAPITHYIISSTGGMWKSDKRPVEQLRISNDLPEMVFGTDEVMQYTLSDCKEGELYYFTVKAVNAVGESDPSPYLATVINPKPKVPAAYISATSSDSSIVLSWPSSGGVVSGHDIFAFLCGEESVRQCNSLNNPVQVISSSMQVSRVFVNEFTVSAGASFQLFAFGFVGSSKLNTFSSKSDIAAHIYDVFRQAHRPSVHPFVSNWVRWPNETYSLAVTFISSAEGFEGFDIRVPISTAVESNSSMTTKVLNTLGRMVGSFSLSYNGERTRDLPTDVSAAQMKFALEAVPSIGHVAVTRSDRFIGVGRKAYTWTVTFLSMVERMAPLVPCRLRRTREMAASRYNISITILNLSSTINYLKVNKEPVQGTSTKIFVRDLPKGFDLVTFRVLPIAQAGVGVLSPPSTSVNLLKDVVKETESKPDRRSRDWVASMLTELHLWISTALGNAICDLLWTVSVVAYELLRSVGSIAIIACLAVPYVASAFVLGCWCIVHVIFRAVF